MEMSFNQTKITKPTHNGISHNWFNFIVFIDTYYFKIVETHQNHTKITEHNLVKIIISQKKNIN